VAVEFGSIATRMQQQTQAAGAAAGTTTGSSEGTFMLQIDTAGALPLSSIDENRLCQRWRPLDLLARGTPMLTAFSAMMHQLLGS
jgi:hypothetical protein